MTGPSRWEFRWEPDAQIVAAVLSMPKASWGMTDMADVDRCWLVAGLGLAGMTAERIDEQLRCSLRLVRTIRAEPATLIAEWAQVTIDAKEDDLRQERGQHDVTRRQLTESRSEAARLRMQLDQILDAHMTGELKLFACGHPRVRFNIYTCRVKDRGKYRTRDFCRECGSGRSVAYRKRIRDNKSDQQNHSDGIASPPHLRSVACGE